MDILTTIKLPKSLAQAGIRSIITQVLQKDGLEGDCGLIIESERFVTDPLGRQSERFTFEVRQLIGKTIKCRSGAFECELDRAAGRLTFVAYYPLGVWCVENHNSIRRLTLCPSFLWRVLMGNGEFAPILADLPELK